MTTTAPSWTAIDTVGGQDTVVPLSHPAVPASESDKRGGGTYGEYRWPWRSFTRTERGIVLDGDVPGHQRPSSVRAGIKGSRSSGDTPKPGESSGDTTEPGESSGDTTEPGKRSRRTPRPGEKYVPALRSAVARIFMQAGRSLDELLSEIGTTAYGPYHAGHIEMRGRAAAERLLRKAWEYWAGQPVWGKVPVDVVDAAYELLGHRLDAICDDDGHPLHRSARRRRLTCEKLFEGLWTAARRPDVRRDHDGQVLSVRLSERLVVKHTGISTGTIHKLKTDAGWGELLEALGITVDAQPRVATVWRVDTSPVQEVRQAECPPVRGVAPAGTPASLSDLTGRKPASRQEQVTHRTWQHGRLGGCRRAIWVHLDDQERSVEELHQQVGRTPRTIRTALRELEETGLAEFTGDGWVRGPVYPDEVANLYDWDDRVAAKVHAMDERQQGYEERLVMHFIRDRGMRWPGAMAETGLLSRYRANGALWRLRDRGEVIDQRDGWKLVEQIDAEPTENTDARASDRPRHDNDDSGSSDTAANGAGYERTDDGHLVDVNTGEIIEPTPTADRQAA